MISLWKLIKLARKWQRLAAQRRKRISFQKSTAAEKGHFAVYTFDGKRFEFPIKYLNTGIIRDLFRMSEEEFGLPGDGPITLPCDAESMEHIISSIRRKKDGDLEKYNLVFSVPITTNGCSYFPTRQRHTGHQLLACS